MLQGGLGRRLHGLVKNILMLNAMKKKSKIGLEGFLAVLSKACQQVV